MPGPFDFNDESDRPRRYHVMHRQALSINGFLSGILKITASLFLLIVIIILVGLLAEAYFRITATKSTTPAVQVKTTTQEERFIKKLDKDLAYIEEERAINERTLKLNQMSQRVQAGIDKLHRAKTSEEIDTATRELEQLEEESKKLSEESDKLSR